MACLLGAGLAGCTEKSEEYYVKHVEFPEGTSLEQKVDMAARVVPTPQQLEWQKLELTAFLHFGINTFTGREWGDGTEDPAIFNPSELDAEQWVKNLKEAGFNMVILTAKHHDGFCLWPTKTTKHSVASSKWKDGKGDVVKELRDACTKYGMKFGVYLSPWDRNAECYGDSPRYNQYFIDQLTELLSNYGEVHEVWFDGANGEGPNGKKQVYDWDAFYKTIQKLQPKATMAIMGDDVRWVGNERGLGRETEWSATVLTPGIYARSEANNGALEISNTSDDLGSRDMLAKASELFWYPSEVDVSIRPGWFYHAEEDGKVKSLKHLTDIYFQSVGYNSVLLLNIPPDRRGLIHENDIARLKEFAAYRQKMLATDYVEDGGELWKAAEGDSREYTLKPDSKINVVLLQEDIAKGQRVEAFTVEAFVDGQWTPLCEGTTIGYKRMLRFADTEAGKLRVTIKSTRRKANICKVAAYYAEPVEEVADRSEWNGLSRAGWKVTEKQPLVIDLGETVSLKAFTYAPLNETAKPTMAFRYKFYVSQDGKQWKEVPTNGEFSNIMHNPLPQTVAFKSVVKARYIKLDATTPSSTPAEVEMNEIGVTLAE
ncbi:MAG TPA: alpha-L-fucosidase [Candidatus Phocaeicola excrementigallinarum]|nr:alpha-L-fucosidase [Candidatus Phocaeicola excrementigallinarum]